VVDISEFHPLPNGSSTPTNDSNETRVRDISERQVDAWFQPELIGCVRPFTPEIPGATQEQGTPSGWCTHQASARLPAGPEYLFTLSPPGIWGVCVGVRM